MNTEKKRNLFDELTQAVNEIDAHKEKKITLRTFTAQEKPKLEVNAALIRETREELHMSRGVFALKLRVSSRTLEKWELGETVPNGQAVVLILMLRKYPDMLYRLEEL